MVNFFGVTTCVTTYRGVVRLKRSLSGCCFAQGTAELSWTFLKHICSQVLFSVVPHYFTFLRLLRILNRTQSDDLWITIWIPVTSRTVMCCLSDVPCECFTMCVHNVWNVFKPVSEPNNTWIQFHCHVGFNIVIVSRMLDTNIWWVSLLWIRRNHCNQVEPYVVRLALHIKTSFPFFLFTNFFITIDL